ncbi:hypothetical protein NFI96_010980 [Prochilodus magdalenae]|nr:hypothetical protein NFI96_010980 [Prochilodus magdalenae]
MGVSTKTKAGTRLTEDDPLLHSESLHDSLGTTTPLQSLVTVNVVLRTRVSWVTVWCAVVLRGAGRLPMVLHQQEDSWRTPTALWRSFLLDTTPRTKLRYYSCGPYSCWGGGQTQSTPPDHIFIMKGWCPQQVTLPGTGWHQVPASSEGQACFLRSRPSVAHRRDDSIMDCVAA